MVWNAENMATYLFLQVMAVTSFFVAVYLYRQRHLDYYSYAHGLLHIFASIGNIYVYLGHIPRHPWPKLL